MLSTKTLNSKKFKNITEYLTEMLGYEQVKEYNELYTNRIFDVTFNDNSGLKMRISDSEDNHTILFIPVIDTNTTIRVLEQLNISL